MQARGGEGLGEIRASLPGRPRLWDANTHSGLKERLTGPQVEGGTPRQPNS